MKRYLLFSGYEYESSGGAGDLVGDFETLESAVREKAPIPEDQWAHVLDTETGEVTEVPGVPREPCRAGIAAVSACDPIPGTFSALSFGREEG